VNSETGQCEHPGRAAKFQQAPAGHLASQAQDRRSVIAAAMAGTVSAMKAGTGTTRLIILRGNSGSGKSSVAAGVRAGYGRGIALVGQDNLRRNVLRERDVAGAANISLIDTVARYALDHGFHVIIDGILDAARYEAMLAGLHRDHRGLSRLYYLDVPFDETVRRHATRPQAAEFGPREMASWYHELDLLPGGIEQIIPATNSLDDTVRQVIRDAGLASHQQTRVPAGPPQARRAHKTPR
jgi:predicted kinase